MSRNSNDSAPSLVSGAVLQRSAPLSSGSTLKPRSDKGKARDAIYGKAKAKYIRAHPTCEFPGCCEEACDIHHTRGKTGELYFDMRWFASVCRIHHGAIHAATGDFLEQVKEWGLVCTRHRGGELDQQESIESEES